MCCWHVLRCCATSRRWLSTGANLACCCGCRQCSSAHSVFHADSKYAMHSAVTMQETSDLGSLLRADCHEPAGVALLHVQRGGGLCLPLSAGLWRDAGIACRELLASTHVQPQCSVHVFLSPACCRFCMSLMRGDFTQVICNTTCRHCKPAGNHPRRRQRGKSPGAPQRGPACDRYCSSDPLKLSISLVLPTQPMSTTAIGFINPASCCPFATLSRCWSRHSPLPVPAQS